MNDKATTAFYGAGLSLVVGYLLSYVSKAVISSMSFYIWSETTMSYDAFWNLYYFTPASLRIATLLCTCIFLAIGFNARSEKPPFVFALISIAFLLGSFVPDILIQADIISYVDPTTDPTVLSGTILHCLFWFSFLVLLILSANALKHDTENDSIQSLRMAFFILFGLSIFFYFMDYLLYFISFEIESITAYMSIYSVLQITELAFAVATGIFLIIAAYRK